MAKAAYAWDFEKAKGFRFKALTEHKHASEEWNAECTAELKEVVASGRGAFKWQSLLAIRGLKTPLFQYWLELRPLAPRPLLWKSAAMRTLAINRRMSPRRKRFASVCVNLNFRRNWSKSPEIERAHDEVLIVKRGCNLIHTHAHTYTQTYISTCVIHHWVPRNSDGLKESLNTEVKGVNTFSLTQGRVEVVQFKCC